MEQKERICRICLTGELHEGSERQLIDVFEKCEQDFSIVDALRKICDVEILDADSYPKHICVGCFSKLQSAYELRRLCQKSQKVLEQIHSKTTKLSVGEEESHYFTVIPADESLAVAADVPIKDEITIEETVVGVPEGSVQCCGCNFVLDSENELKEHALQKHRRRRSCGVVTASRRFQCMICYSEFSDFDTATTHQAGKHRVRFVIKCEFCRCKFFTAEALKTHQEDFHSDGMFKCCGCDYRSNSQEAFIEHSNNHKAVWKNDPAQPEFKSFQCHVCYGSFSLRKDLQRHEAFPYRKAKINRKAKEIIAPCCGCDKLFTSKDELHAHQEQDHKPKKNTQENKDTSFECSQCYMRFKTQTKLDKHLHGALYKKRYQCNKCVVSRRTVELLLEHMVNHNGRQSFICCGCQRKFDTNEDLQKHSIEDHASEAKRYLAKGRPFRCSICYRTFKEEMALLKHQRYVYKDKNHKCQICSKTFTKKSALIVHITLHNEKTTHPCPTCGKHYRHKFYANKCFKRHENFRKFQCEVCKASFSSQPRLKMHSVVHNEEHQHKCDSCNRFFKRKENLRKHQQQIHGREKNFSCRHCPLRFHSKTELSAHEKRHIGLVQQYRCDICGKAMSKRNYFIKHYEAHMHSSAKVHKCNLCKKRFSEDHFLANHIKYTHRIEPENNSWREKFDRLRNTPASVVRDGEDEEQSEEMSLTE